MHQGVKENTFVTNLILAKARGDGNVALAVASSDIASTLIPGGGTVYLRINIPLIVNKNTLCKY